MGDGGVGKTTMVKRLCYGKFIPQKITIGTDLAMYDLTLNNTLYKLQLWDFAGEKRFRFFLPSYCRGADACIFVFDLTRPDTFNAINAWVYEFEDFQKVEGKEKGTIKILLGNKSDLMNERKVSMEESVNLANRFKMRYFDTSALNGENVQKGFLNIANQLVKLHGSK